MFKTNTAEHIRKNIMSSAECYKRFHLRQKHNLNLQVSQNGRLAHRQEKTDPLESDVQNKPPDIIETLSKR